MTGSSTICAVAATSAKLLARLALLTLATIVTPEIAGSAHRDKAERAWRGFQLHATIRIAAYAFLVAERGLSPRRRSPSESVPATCPIRKLPPTRRSTCGGSGTLNPRLGSCWTGVLQCSFIGSRLSRDKRRNHCQTVKPHRHGSQFLFHCRTNRYMHERRRERSG